MRSTDPARNGSGAARTVQEADRAHRRSACLAAARSLCVMLLAACALGVALAGYSADTEVRDDGPAVDFSTPAGSEVSPDPSVTPARCSGAPAQEAV